MATINTIHSFLAASRNQLGVADNRYQNYNRFPRVLYVCSAGVLRSATAGAIFSAAPFYYNTRNAGAEMQYALIPVSQTLLEWADRIVVFTEENVRKLDGTFGTRLEDYQDKIEVWDVPDNFSYRAPELIILLVGLEQSQTFKRISYAEGGFLKLVDKSPLGSGERETTASTEANEA